MLRRLIHDDTAVATGEYALLGALILVVALVGLLSVRDSIATLWDNIANAWPY